MAIDSAAKRLSVSGILTGLTIVGVTPDATPDVAWRQSAGWGYEGIEALAPAATPIVTRLSHEFLFIPVVPAERLSIPTVLADRLSIPVVPPEILRC